MRLALCHHNEHRTFVSGLRTQLRMRCQKFAPLEGLMQLAARPGLNKATVQPEANTSHHSESWGKIFNRALSDSRAVP
jgi:hypothetical protein